jgi:hypothetical protein
MIFSENRESTFPDNALICRPEIDGFVIAARGETVAFRRDRKGAYGSGMAGQCV